MALQGRLNSARSRGERRNALLTGYRPLPGAYDELMAPDGTVRPQWEPFLTEWAGLSADELQRRVFDWLDQPIMRVHGGEASPSISKVLEQAAFARPKDIEAGIRAVMAAQGRPLA